LIINELRLNFCGKFPAICPQKTAIADISTNLFSYICHMEILILIGVFAAGIFGYTQGVKAGRGQKADNYERHMAAVTNFMRLNKLPIYHIAAHPFDDEVSARASKDRATLDAMGKHSIAVHALPYSGIGLDGRPNFGESSYPEYIIRVAREIKDDMNLSTVNIAQMHGKGLAHEVAAGQRPVTEDWQYINKN
jgi:hypothetical protein